MPSEAEIINDRLLKRVAEIYSESEEKILSSVAKRVKRGITTEGWNERKLKELQEMQEEINRLMNSKNSKVKKQMSKSIIDSYNAGRSEVTSKGTPKSVLSSLEISRKLQRQILESENIIDGTNFQILRNVDDVYRKVMSDATSGTLVGTDTLKNAAQKALNQFAAKGITGFIDKAGRKWDLQAYAMMASRTIAQNAAKQGHLDRMTELGRDLIIVSSHSPTCPLCAPWGNKILSISGQDKRFYSLDDATAAGLFHPNCKHTILDYDEEDSDSIDKMLGIEHGPEGLEALDADNDEKYLATQMQRYNESQIRKWKRYSAVALDDNQKIIARNKVAEYQSRNRQLTDRYGFKRDYAREGNIIGDASKAIKYKDYPAINLQEQVEKKELMDVSDKTKRRLYNQNERHVISAKDNLDKFENTMVEFTAGGSTIPDDTLAVISNDKVAISHASADDLKIAETIIDIVEKAPTYSNEIYRIEEAGYNKLLKEKIGSEFSFGLRSFSRSEEWINAAISGEQDIFFEDPIVYRLKNAKSINLRPYSPYFAEQEEAATLGRFKIKNITEKIVNGIKVKYIDIEQISVR